MGQKVHPYGFRLGVTKTWRSRWFAKQDYAKLLREDLELKDSLRDRLKAAGVSSIEVDRPGNKLRITIHTSRPGIIIGRKGAEIEKLKSDLAKKTKREVFIDIQEVHKPELDAQLVSESIALQLEKRVAFRQSDAQSGRFGAALRLQGNQGSRVGPLERRGNRAHGMVSARAASAAHAARRYRLRIQPGVHDLRRDRDQVLGLQGRDSAGRPAPRIAQRAGAAPRCRRATRPRTRRSRRSRTGIVRRVRHSRRRAEQAESVQADAGRNAVAHIGSDSAADGRRRRSRAGKQEAEAPSTKPQTTPDDGGKTE